MNVDFMITINPLFSFDFSAESELSKLQRQYRIMEGDRNAYNIESQDLIRRQL